MGHSSPPRKRSRGGGGSSRETTSTAIAIEDDREESRERALSLELESSSDDDDGEDEDDDDEEEEPQQPPANGEDQKRNGGDLSGGRSGESQSTAAGLSVTSTSDMLKTVARHTTAVLQKAWAVEKACDVALRLKRHTTRMRVHHAGVRRQRMQLVLRVITEEAAKPMPTAASKTAAAVPVPAPRRFVQHILVSAEKKAKALSSDPPVEIESQDATIDVTDAVKTIAVRYVVRLSLTHSLQTFGRGRFARRTLVICLLLARHVFSLATMTRFVRNVLWCSCLPIDTCTVRVSRRPVTRYGLAAARSQNPHRRQTLARVSCARAARTADPPSHRKLRSQRRGWGEFTCHPIDKYFCLSSRSLLQWTWQRWGERLHNN